MADSKSLIFLGWLAWAGASLAARAEAVVQRLGDNFVAFEAESADAFLAAEDVRWIEIEDPDAAGGRALYTEGSSLGNPAGIAFFKIRFSNPGDYVLYSRWKSDAREASENPFAANSFSYGRTFAPEPVWVRSRANERNVPESLEFGWTEENVVYEVTEEDVAAGMEFTFQVGTREAGLILDRLALMQGQGISHGELDAAMASPDASAVPGVVNLYGQGSNSVVIRFSVPLGGVSLENFKINGLSVLSAALDPQNPSVATLETAAQVLGNNYEVLIQGLAGAAGAPIFPGTSALFRAADFESGWVRLHQSSGSDPVQWLESFEFQAVNAAAGEIELSGFFVPPDDGRYVLYLRNSDPAELAFWRDDSELNILYAQSETSSAEFGEGALLTPILSPGTKYFITARMSHAAGAADLAVAARRAGGEQELRPIEGEEVESLLSSEAANLILVEQPADVSVAAGATASFTAGVTSDFGPIFYQWQRNGLDLPGAKGAVLTTPPLTAGASGDRYRVVVKAAGATVTSRDARVVAVNPGSLRISSGNGVVVSWEEWAAGAFLERADALDAGAEWTPVPEHSPIAGAGSHAPADGTAGFFRLRN